MLITLRNIKVERDERELIEKERELQERLAANQEDEDA